MNNNEYTYTIEDLTKMSDEELNEIFKGEPESIEEIKEIQSEEKILNEEQEKLNQEKMIQESRSCLVSIFNLYFNEPQNDRFWNIAERMINSSNIEDVPYYLIKNFKEQKDEQKDEYSKKILKSFLDLDDEYESYLDNDSFALFKEIRVAKDDSDEKERIFDRCEDMCSSYDEAKNRYSREHDEYETASEKYRKLKLSFEGLSFKDEFSPNPISK